ncbi:MAG: sigma-70 family RNA polymerase sigma factor [Bacilli bacterium]|nr:sigma-70 family RNA polymerase sigma factor [Bacilli bacterium]
MQNKKQLKELIANEYLNRFLTFYISKTSSVQDAEDLSQKAACECLDALDRVDEIKNINAYFWSVAHNVYKNYLNRKNNHILDDDYCKMQIADISYYEDNEKQVLHNDIRKSLSILSGLYRKIIVLYYYHELKIKDISEKLNISQDMVKYYLSNGKKKLKEIYIMNKEIGELSFNPKDFSIYYSGIDFTSVNVWELFKRKLPCQIALACYAKPKTVSEISSQVGCSSCFIEDELSILLKAGVLTQKVKDKYQTNFYIISEEELSIVDDLYKKMYNEYTKEVSKVFDEHFEKIKNTGIYNYNATMDQYKWIFADRVADMDRRNMFTKDSDYPKILSCGARGLVFGLEAPTPKGTCGQTPTYLNNHTLWARDLWMKKGYSSNQPILRDKKAAQTVIDVYNGIVDDNNEELYAYLIKNNILVKDSGVLKTNIAYLNKEFLELMKNINKDLYVKLEKSTCEIKEYLTKVFDKSIPNNLKKYAKGYVITLMQFFAGNKIIEELIANNFLNDKLENIQISYFINK